MKDTLSLPEKRAAIQSIQRYMADELETELGEMQAGFLLDYFFKELAPFAYNQGVADARDFLLQRMEDLDGTCFEETLTYWTPPRRKKDSRP